MHARGLSVVALALALIASSCSHHTNPRAQRVVASPGKTPVAGLETPVPTPSGTPRTDSRSAARVSLSTPTPPPVAPVLAKAHTTLTRIASLSEPLAIALRANDSALYVAEKGGTIRAIRSGRVDAAPVLDISTEVSTGSEQGLLGLAFSPDGAFLYVNFTNKSGTTGDTVVREYTFSNGRATGPGRQVLTQTQPFGNHNGGNLVFGPDGFLYIGLGDGGSGGDPTGNGQNLNTLLGKMLRINPRPSGSAAYQIPHDNPLYGQPGKKWEIWAYGLRNPWRYSFDKDTKDLWVGDVGQDSWEEVDYQRAPSSGGDNYGWNRMEGTHSYNGGSAPANHHPPVYEYSHSDGNCSITGGYVYRGSRIPNLVGAYVFGDFCGGRLRAFVLHNGRAADHRFLGPQVNQLSAFGQDANGELYVTSLTGGVYRIDPA